VLCPSVDMRTDVEIRDAFSGHFGLHNPQNPMPSIIEIISAIGRLWHCECTFPLRDNLRSPAAGPTRQGIFPNRAAFQLRKEQP
jgi:hypothetical protein